MAMTTHGSLNSSAIQRRYGNPVWQFFKIDEESLAQICSSCGQKLNAPPNTTNSKKHLKAKHPDLYEIVRRQDEENQTQKVPRRKRKLSGSESSSCTYSQKDGPPEVDITKMLQSMIENFNTDYALCLPEHPFSKEEITLSDSDAVEQDTKPFPNTNFGNNALLSLYNHNKPLPALATVSPTISTKPINNNSITLPSLPIHGGEVLFPKESQTQEPSTKKRSVRKAAVSDKDTFKCSVPSLKRSDIGGVTRQFVEAFRLVKQMKRFKTFEKRHVQPPVGILIHGPPGCGKTRFAQCLAGELMLPLIQVSCTELIAGVSGESENKIRNLFQQAKENGPCLLLLDEVDVIASRRDSAQREMEKRVVTQLIASLDGLSREKHPSRITGEEPLSLHSDSSGNISIANRPNGQVMVIAITSKLESIDMALRRAGRFDKELSIGIPREKERTEILSVVCRNIGLSSDVSLKQIARLTPGYVGADLVALAREAFVSAVNRVMEPFPERNEKEQWTEEEMEKEIENGLISWFNPEEISSEKECAMTVEFKDFERALTLIGPSSIREGFATVPDVNWDDIGALQKVRSELEWSILIPIKRPEIFHDLGTENKPQGVLLCGPPGCGKTLLAKAIANESGLNFISVKGPELLNMYVGESERAVRTVFQRARDSAPCVIFFDEIDALCPKRNHNETSGSSRLVNQMLTEMDGVEGRNQVFLMAATNRPDIVDPAILRPGRLDKIIFVDFPNAEGRSDILRKATKNGTRPKISADVNFDDIANLPALENYTGADLSALIREACVFALSERLTDVSVCAITRAHFIAASQRITPSVTQTARLKYEELREKYKKI